MNVALTLSPRDYDVVLFDLDGVPTRTAGVHAAAWKKLFDGFLHQLAIKAGNSFVPFDIETGYPRYVDGKPRYEGVADFLRSHGIELPLGAPEDGPAVQSVHALGDLKDRYFLEQLGHQGVEPYEPATAPNARTAAKYDLLIRSRAAFEGARKLGLRNVRRDARLSARSLRRSRGRRMKCASDALCFPQDRVFHKTAAAVCCGTIVAVPASRRHNPAT